MKFFKKSKEPKDLKEVLKQFEQLKEKVSGISKGLESLKKSGNISIQKVGIVRYNPFSGAGGDQSFSIALLNGDNNGVVITSLYARDGNRVYGKSVRNSNSEYPLSEEEKKAIKSAMSFE